MAYIASTWVIIEAMAPYLLMGLLLAGVMHVFLPKDFIYKKLSQPGMATVFKASLLGVPMPLCSCSVIPVAQHLHKSGASRGSILSFIASTPSTGLDSITAIWGLMGPVYTLFKLALAFLSGWLVGFLSLQSKSEAKPHLPSSQEGRSSSETPPGLSSDQPRTAGMISSLKIAIDYALNDLFKDFALWLFIGTLLGASLEFIIPQNFGVAEELLWSYLFVIMISMPLYVCATGSIPIALGLLAQGFSPGSALLFLTLGPITNAATMTWLWGSFGMRMTSLYFGAIASLAISAAWIMDSFFRDIVTQQALLHQHEEGSLLGHVISVLFCVIWAFHLTRLLWKNLKKWFKTSPVKPPEGREIAIEGMTCENCVSKVESILEAHGVIAEVDLTRSCIFINSSEVSQLESVSDLLAMKGYPLKLSDLQRNSSQTPQRTYNT